MKLPAATFLLTASLLAPSLLAKSPLLDAPGPGYREEEAPVVSVLASQAELPEVTWPLYLPGEVPEGKRLSIAQAALLSRGAYVSSPLYLTGDFVAAATAYGRAVLRDRSAPALARVVVLYPPEISVPAEGAKVNRNAGHPFQIRNVERNSDGQVTIFVRDIVHPSPAK